MGQVVECRDIRLNDMNDIKQLVTIATQVDFYVDVQSGHSTIDAESVLGLLSLDLNRPVTVAYNGYDKNFEAFLAAHKCA